MTVHPNVSWLIALDDAFEAGGLDAYFAGFADDVVVHVAGRSAIGGTVHGKAAMGEVFQRFSERGGQMSFERHLILADDDHGVLLWGVRCERDDATFTGTESMVVHIANGVITEAWIDFEDRYEFDAFIG